MESVSFNATPSEADEPMGTDASVRAVVLCVVQLNVQSYSPVGVNVRQPLQQMHGSVSPHEPALQAASQSVQLFLQGSRSLPTDTHTHVHTQRPRYINTSAAERCQLSQ